MLELLSLVRAICLSAWVRECSSYLKRDMRIGKNSVVGIEQTGKGTNGRKPCLSKWSLCVWAERVMDLLCHLHEDECACVEYCPLFGKKACRYWQLWLGMWVNQNVEKLEHNWRMMAYLWESKEGWQVCRILSGDEMMYLNIFYCGKSQILPNRKTSIMCHHIPTTHALAGLAQ